MSTYSLAASVLPTQHLSHHCSVVTYRCPWGMLYVRDGKDCGILVPLLRQKLLSRNMAADPPLQYRVMGICCRVDSSLYWPLYDFQSDTYGAHFFFAASQV
jgi:hypothetical protein